MTDTTSAAPNGELALGWLRYEKARKLNPAQWAALHQRNLAGERFDDMIDALPSPGTPWPTPPAVVEPLTDEQIDKAIQRHVDPVATYRKLHDFARAIEAAAHGIKGGSRG